MNITLGTATDRLQRTWGLVLVLAGVLGQLLVALGALAIVDPGYSRWGAVFVPVVLALLAVLTLILLLPFIRAALRFLRSVDLPPA